MDSVSNKRLPLQTRKFKLMINIVNVVEVINGMLDNIESWSSDNSGRAEDEFKKRCLQHGALEEDLEIHVENGYYESKFIRYKIYLSWSQLN